MKPDYVFWESFFKNFVFVFVLLLLFCDMKVLQLLSVSAIVSLIVTTVKKMYQAAQKVHIPPEFFDDGFGDL